VAEQSFAEVVANNLRVCISVAMSFLTRRGATRLEQVKYSFGIPRVDARSPQTDYAPFCCCTMRRASATSSSARRRSSSKPIGRINTQAALHAWGCFLQEHSVAFQPLPLFIQLRTSCCTAPTVAMGLTLVQICEDCDLNVIRLARGVVKGAHSACRAQLAQCPLSLECAIARNLSAPPRQCVGLFVLRGA
jgi:hypothetical protein